MPDKHEPPKDDWVAELVNIDKKQLDQLLADRDWLRGENRVLTYRNNTQAATIERLREALDNARKDVTRAQNKINSMDDSLCAFGDRVRQQAQQIERLRGAIERLREAASFEIFCSVGREDEFISVRTKDYEKLEQALAETDPDKTEQDEP